MNDILESVLYAAVFLAVSLPILALSWFVLDVITPGHKLADRLADDVSPSGSAAVVTSAWMIAQAGIIFTAIWTNGVGDHFGEALGWSVVFSLVGLVFQTVAFFVLDLVTPGKLGDEICVLGPARPLAWVAAANVIAVGLIVIAVIS